MFAATLLFAAPARAQNCTFTFTPLSFGTVNLVPGDEILSTATMNVNCTAGLLSPRTIKICPHFGGLGGNPRYIAGTPNLNFQMYSDAGRNTIWGSAYWPFPSRPPALFINLPLLATSGSTSATIYGRIMPNQETVDPGTYTFSQSGSHMRLEYAYATGGDCNTGLGGSNKTNGFTISAIVDDGCLVTADDVNFGTTAVLGSNIDTTGTVRVTCSPSTSYRVGLSNGVTGTGPTTRRMTLGANIVTYGLYRNAARSQAWGTTTGTSVAGTGNGNEQPITVYGRVPPQTTPLPGAYADTVIVTVTY